MVMHGIQCHDFTYNLVDSSVCPTCGHEETTSHSCFDCITYATACTKLLGIDCNNKQQLLQTILHGTIDYQQNLLNVVCQ